MKRILSLALALTLCASLTVPALAAEYADVPADHWAYAAIQSAAEKGIAAGYADGTFHPTASVTRAQFCVMLSRAFFPSEVEKLTTDENKAQGWFVPNTLALKDAGVLDNTTFENYYTRAEIMKAEISRYDMAQLMANILAVSGRIVSETGKTAAQAKIADTVSTKYQDAVYSCYSLGILGGLSDGTFGGQNSMNRAQGCVVIDRLANCIGKIPGPTSAEDPNETQEDALIGASQEDPSASGEEPKPTTVTPTTSATETGTKWTIPDNGYGAGYLNNGKPISEANVLAMLTEAEKIWPTDMEWSEDKGSITNNYYGRINAGKTGDTRYAVRILSKSSDEYACGGFAAMVSDYIFGPSTNNICRRLNDNTQVRPGDIVVHVTGGKTRHIMIATTSVFYVNGRPAVMTADGNIGGMVNWSADNGQAIDSYTNSSGESVCVIYTRYPA